jgi:hypothetical protein
MNPDYWGPYGWKMIHSFSRLQLNVDEYRSWLKTVVGILPCRKCRRNFRKHLHSSNCQGPKTPEALSICLHDAVNKEKERPVWGDTHNQSDLPPAINKNLFEPTFWMTMSLNTTLRKNTPIFRFLIQTEKILILANRQKEADLVKKLRLGEYCPILEHEQDCTRKRYLEHGIRQMMKDLEIDVPPRSVLVKELHVRGDRLSATRKRARTPIRNSPSGSWRKSLMTRKITFSL